MKWHTSLCSKHRTYNLRTLKVYQVCMALNEKKAQCTPCPLSDK